MANLKLILARAMAAQERLLQFKKLAEGPTPRPLLLKGVGKIAGDGWKDTTTIGEIVYVWNREKPAPYAAGQFPRLGNPIYSASTEQYDFTPCSDEEAIAIIDQQLGEAWRHARDLNEQAGQDQILWLSPAAIDALAERRRQIEIEGWTPEHDDKHTNGGMAIAAACYAIWGLPRRVGPDLVSKLWPWTGWSRAWFKPKERRRNLVRAIALLLAEVEREDRAVVAASTEKGGAA